MRRRPLSPQRKKLLRIFAVLAVLPCVGLMAFIAIFVARAELAHDESTCPFETVETRVVRRGSPPVSVLEERRSCQDGVEERRWSVLRGDSVRELGRRRLPVAAFRAEVYSWTPELRGDFVHVDIRNDGVEPGRFREGPE
jgi:hypothetical protein